MFYSRTPTKATIPSPGSSTFGADFVKKVKQRYAKQPGTYKKFLAIWKKFHELQCGVKHMPIMERRNVVNEIYFEVVTLFQSSDDLVEEFRNYMSGNGPDGGDHFGVRGLTTNKSSSPTTSSISTQSPKRRASIKTTSDDVSLSPPSSISTKSTQPLIPTTPKRRTSVKPVTSDDVSLTQRPFTRSWSAKSTLLPSTPKRRVSTMSANSEETSPTTEPSSSTQSLICSTLKRLDTKTTSQVIITNTTNLLTSPYATRSKTSSNPKRCESTQSSSCENITPKSLTFPQQQFTSSSARFDFIQPTTIRDISPLLKLFSESQTSQSPKSKVDSSSPLSIRSDKMASTQPLSLSTLTDKSESPPSPKRIETVTSNTIKSDKKQRCKPTLASRPTTRSCSTLVSNLIFSFEPTSGNMSSSFTSAVSVTSTPIDLSFSNMSIHSSSDYSTESVEQVRVQSVSPQANLFYPNFDEMDTDLQLPSASSLRRNLINEFDQSQSLNSTSNTVNSQAASPKSADDLIVIDASDLKRVGTSYVKFHSDEKCSGRSWLGENVLNDSLAICGVDYKANETKHDAVHDMFRMENERAHLDHVIETTRSTMDHLAKLIDQIDQIREDDPSKLVEFTLDHNLNGSSGKIYRKSIERIYGQDKFDSIYRELRRFPAIAVPQAHYRLCEKYDEWKRKQEDFFIEWRQETDAVYLKSLDVLGATFREDDSKQLERDSMSREIMHHREQANGGQPALLLKQYPLETFMKVANELIMHFVLKHPSIQLRREKAIKEKLTQFMPDILLKRKYQLEESKIFYGNDNWYYFIRLYILLCERLRHMQNVESDMVKLENDELEQQMEKCANSGQPFVPKKNEGVPTSDYFTCLIVLVKMMLDKKLTAEQYKDELRDMFGNKAYTAYTLDLIVEKIVVELQELLNERNSIKCMLLFVQSQEAIATAALHSAEDIKQKALNYNNGVKYMITTDHLIKIVFDKVNGHVSFEYELNEIHSSSPLDLSKR